MMPLKGSMRMSIKDIIYEKYSRDGRIPEDVSRDDVFNNIARFSDRVSGIESSYGTNLINPDSSARGEFQFLTKGDGNAFQTGLTRLQNAYVSMKMDLPAWATQAMDHQDPLKLSPQQQEEVMLANIYMQKSSNLEGMLQGNDESGLDLYFKYHHTKPDPATVTRAKEYFGKEPDKDNIMAFLPDNLRQEAMQQAQLDTDMEAMRNSMSPKETQMFNDLEREGQYQQQEAIRQQQQQLNMAQQLRPEMQQQLNMQQQQPIATTIPQQTGGLLNSIKSVGQDFDSVGKNRFAGHIAYENGMTLDELQDLNPEVEITRGSMGRNLQDGQQLRVGKGWFDNLSNMFS